MPHLPTIDSYFSTRPGLVSKQTPIPHRLAAHTIAPYVDDTPLITFHFFHEQMEGRDLWCQKRGISLVQ